MNFFNEFKDYIVADDDITTYRRKICDTCEFLKKPSTRCEKCGCFMKVKNRVGFSKCPEGKW